MPARICAAAYRSRANGIAKQKHARLDGPDQLKTIFTKSPGGAPGAPSNPENAAGVRLRIRVTDRVRRVYFPRRAVRPGRFRTLS